jgi:hypothetical protein
MWRYMLMFLLLCVGSPCLAQSPTPLPIPDDGPGGGVSVCVVCNGIEEAIATNRAKYDALELQIDGYDAEIADCEDLIDEINANQVIPQEEKDILIAAVRRDIIGFQAQILIAEIDLEATAEVINGLWDSWFATGCDEADC